MAGTVDWDGIRNAQARNFIRSMRPGDQALIYHTGSERAFVGISEIVTEPTPEAAGETPGSAWWMIRIKALRALKRPVPLALVKQTPELSALVLLRQGRLSVSPMTPEQFAAVLALES